MKKILFLLCAFALHNVAFGQADILSNLQSFEFNEETKTISEITVTIRCEKEDLICAELDVFLPAKKNMTFIADKNFPAKKQKIDKKKKSSEGEVKGLLKVGETNFNASLSFVVHDFNSKKPRVSGIIWLKTGQLKSAKDKIVSFNF
tara:strand:- start:267 stop:707 length:441 start_codon:yes stop_codon:yes gene_type:complete